MKEQQGCLSVFLSLLGIRLPGPTSSTSLPYRRRDDFLSAAELSFYRVLRQSVGEKGVVFCKVNLADVFFIADPNKNCSYRNRIDRKHVDFLVCDPMRLDPRLGIELDDASHTRQDRQARDQLVDVVFAAAGLRLERIPVKAGYNLREIQSLVLPHLEVEDKQPTSAPPVENEIPICPKCCVPMVLRTASKGVRAGQQFYGCKNYPKCGETAKKR